MPLTAMDAAVIDKWVAAVDPDLRIQMDQAGISKHLVAVLGEAGFTSTRLFRCFAPNQESVTKSAKLAGLDAEENLQSMAQVARLQMVWCTVNALQTAEDTDKAEKKVLGVTRQLNKSVYMVLKQQYARKNGKTTDELLPGATILERLDLDLEEGEFRAPRLTEVPSKKEVSDANTERTDAQGVAITMTATGARIVQSAKVKVAVCADAEDGYRPS